MPGGAGASSYVSEDTLRCEGDIRAHLDAKGRPALLRLHQGVLRRQGEIRSGEGRGLGAGLGEHITCRAVNARRLDLHLAVSLKALAVVQRQEQLTSGLEGEGIQVRGERRSASQAVNALSHQFTLEDRLPLKNGKPPMESILRKEISCRVTDCKLAQGQLAVSGRADISFLYLTSVDGSLEKMAASVEFSQVIECAGASEDCLCDLRVVAGESSLQPREDDVGEYTSVDVSLKVFLTAFLYQPCEVELVSDAFSTQAPMDLRFAQSSLLAVQEVYSEVLKKKCTLTATEEEIQKVVDLWCEQEGVQSTCGEGKLSYRVRYTLCLLYRGTSGRLLYLEKSFEGTFATELEGAFAQRSDSVSLTGLWEYRIADKNTVEASVETWVSSLLYSRESVSYLSSAGMGENAQPYPHQPQLLVYYASPGERLWDIAKSHRALLSDLQEQNDLYEDTLPDARPLIICNR
ncbi:MAG: DUF3794 domain-containing protein [Acutalibacter sp.]